jgi:hypothetical protein
MLRVGCVLFVFTIALSACAMPGKGGGQSRYVDPLTCEIENRKPEDPPFDADCIRAAQNAAEAYAKASKKK